MKKRPYLSEETIGALFAIVAYIIVIAISIANKGKEEVPTERISKFWLKPIDAYSLPYGEYYFKEPAKPGICFSNTWNEKELYTLNKAEGRYSVEAISSPARQKALLKQDTDWALYLFAKQYCYANFTQGHMIWIKGYLSRLADLPDSGHTALGMVIRRQSKADTKAFILDCNNNDLSFVNPWMRNIYTVNTIDAEEEHKVKLYNLNVRGEQLLVHGSYNGEKMIDFYNANNGSYRHTVFIPQFHEQYPTDIRFHGPWVYVLYNTRLVRYHIAEQTCYLASL